ncbi:MAG: L-2-amino-thiazoline-4-carboxylic acid hydrolase [Clostridia bacterium]|nr:L-2-amino-thiazoline-4-carboxylic acid hydrolase [Clostridia bacterium]
MWALYKGSFQNHLVSVLGFKVEEAARVAAAAKPKYKEIIAKLPPFEKGDRFKMNIISCAMLASFLLSMTEKPAVDALADFYAKAMMNAPTRLFFRWSDKRKFSEKDIAGMKATADLNAADRNLYSWNMEFLPYADGSGYEARFSKCGICTLMRELGLFDLVPAMCHLDYDMTDAGGTADFVREFTLASGGPYCDCGYIKKEGRDHDSNNAENRRHDVRHV